MNITPYGYRTIFFVFSIAFAIVLLGYVLSLPNFFLSFLILSSFLMIVFTLQFFRDPVRIPPNEPNVIVSPADGKIVVVKEVDHSFFNGKSLMVSVFMSPLNVHVNRNPISGKVTHFKYIEGQFIAAFDNDSGNRNERTEIAIENKSVKIFFKQISGFVARRIICELKEGDETLIGDRFGMIKFGSRVDMFLPITVDLKVKLGETTTAGETVIASYHS